MKKETTAQVSTNVIMSNRFILRESLLNTNTTVLVYFKNSDAWNAYDHDAVFNEMCNKYNLHETESWKKHKYYTNTRNLPMLVRDLAITDVATLQEYSAIAKRSGRQEAKNLVEGRKAAQAMQVATILEEAAELTEA